MEVKDPFKVTDEPLDEEEVQFNVDGENGEDIEEVIDEPVEPDEFLGSDESEDDSNEMFTEEDLRRVNPLYYQQYENQNNFIDRDKYPLEALERVVKELYQQHEDLAISHHTSHMTLKYIKEQINSLLELKTQTQNTLKKIEEFRRAEDLSDVDFNEIVNRVMAVISNKGIIAPQQEKNENKQKPKTNIFSVSIILSLVAIFFSAYTLYSTSKMNVKSMSNETKQEQLEQIAVVPKGTKVKCGNDFFETLQDAKIKGILQNDKFFYQNEKRQTCWFKME